MQTVKVPSAEPELGVRASRAAPVIVATDGRKQSDGALIVGRLLAGSLDAVRVVSALRPLPFIPDSQVAAMPDIEAARGVAAKNDIATQMRRVWNNEEGVELLNGDPATVVAKLAHASGATMIVAGLGRHRTSDRVFGDETALRLIRISAVPVLAVSEGATRVPHRIVVAIDFSETSLRAARLAIELASSGATIYLAHVAPRDSSLYDWQGVGSSYKEDAGGALQKVRAQLRVPKEMIVQQVLLQGDPATELLAFTASINGDLIATGSHGHGFVARMLIGSVATRLVRCSTCSVLTVPHAAAMTQVRTTVEPSVVTNIPQTEWTTELDEFTRRNLGRSGTLEVDDPEIGAQAQEFDYPFAGATFDEHDQMVELMFGQSSGTRRHLSRGIGNVTSVDVLRDEEGRDLALRIAHGAGQTLLTFAS